MWGKKWGSLSFERGLTHNGGISGLQGDSSLHLVTTSNFINVS